MEQKGNDCVVTTSKKQHQTTKKKKVKISYADVTESHADADVTESHADADVTESHADADVTESHADTDNETMTFEASSRPSEDRPETGVFVASAGPSHSDDSPESKTTSWPKTEVEEGIDFELIVERKVEDLKDNPSDAEVEGAAADSASDADEQQLLNDRESQNYHGLLHRSLPVPPVVPTRHGVSHSASHSANQSASSSPDGSFIITFDGQAVRLDEGSKTNFMSLLHLASSIIAYLQCSNVVL